MGSGDQERRHEPSLPHEELEIGPLATAGRPTPSLTEMQAAHLSAVDRLQASRVMVILTLAGGRTHVRVVIMVADGIECVQLKTVIQPALEHGKRAHH